jgi:hypothetical protein
MSHEAVLFGGGTGETPAPTELTGRRRPDHRVDGVPALA